MATTITSSAGQARTRASRAAGGAALDYAMALAAGTAAVAMLLPLPTLFGTGGLWGIASGDIARSLTGHLAFQADPWRWPLLSTRMLLWPQAASVAMADSNSAASLLAKAISRASGTGPVNLLGAWLGLCVLLQPVTAVYALRGAVRGRPEAALAVALLSLLSLPWLFRVVHPNLMGHFAILAALGLALRIIAGRARRGWAAAGALMGAAVLFHPYLFLMVAAVLAAVPADRTLAWLVARDRPALRAMLRGWAALALACAAPLLLFQVLNGDFADGAGADGFGYYSMNLLSPVWPHLSGVFGMARPGLDATGGQGEGFNYLGAGVLFLVAAAGASLAAARRWPRPPAGLLVSLAALAALALSTHVYAGSWRLLDVNSIRLDQFFAPVRASGRFFWPVGYALLVGAAAAAATHLPRWAGAAVLACAVLLQAADAGPLRQRAEWMLAGMWPPPPPGLPVPSGATLVRIVPPIPCLHDEPSSERATSLMLHAARAGIRLSGAGLARVPRGFSCEKAGMDAVEAPLEPGEARVFLDPGAQPRIRGAWLGEGARCGVADGVTTCGNGLGAQPGEDVPARGGPGAPLARVRAVSDGLAGAALRPLLASGWEDGSGPPETHGRYATLLFALDGLPPGAGVRVTLHIQPIGSGGKRKPRAFLVRAGAGDAVRVKARDEETAVASAWFPAAAAASGVFRVALNETPGSEFPSVTSGVWLRLLGVDIAPDGAP